MKTPDDPRLEKLRRLVINAGGPASFARTYSAISQDKDGVGIDPTYVSQLLNGHRRFGDNSRRNMAIRAGLPIGYFELNEGDFIEGEFKKVEKEQSLHQLIATIPKPISQRDKDIEEITRLARKIDATGLGMLLRYASDLVEIRPAKQTPESTE